MKVQIRDKDALESLTTANLRAYLETHGWVDVRHWGERGTIHSKEQCGKLWEIAIPNREDCSDYAEFMAEAVTTLAEAEDRLQPDVFYDLANPRTGGVWQDIHRGADSMTNVWCVRAEFGKYTDQFVAGGFAGIGWIPDEDLTNINDKGELYPLYKEAYPEDTSKFVVGQQVGQIARFLLEIETGDYIITPTVNSALLRYGRVISSPYYEQTPQDSCPFPHRCQVDWAKHPLNREEFSMPLQFTLRGSLTIFAVSQREEFLAAIGQSDAVLPTAGQPKLPRPDTYQVVLEQILNLDATEFEMLVGHLLTALGFEGSAVVGKSGDGGVDVTGELNVSNLATVKLFVQAKRYSQGTRINANTVRQLRAAIPYGGQGAFITTADYQKDAWDVASDPNFARIGLINGHQLVDLLIEHWDDIDPEFRETLGLKPGLVPA